MNSKPVSASVSTMTELVLPNDTNTLDNLMGGRMMHWMDIISAIAAQRHSGLAVVTASVDNVSFNHPVSLGSIVTFQAQVTRAFRTSMEVYIRVYAENIPHRLPRQLTNSAFYTFVAMDALGRPTDVPELDPETEEEKKLFDDALSRRQLRLVLAGKMKASEAPGVRQLLGL